MKNSVKSWTFEQLRFHKQAARKLEQILKQATARIKNKKYINEEQLHKFIVDKMIKAGLTSVLNWAIVAYGPSADNPHYHFKPNKSRLIKPNHFLLIDIWGKLNIPDAPYADITQMYFVGGRPSVYFQKLWDDVKNARDRALEYIQQHHTAHGVEIHKIAKKYLDHCGHQGLFLHGLGHDLGYDHPHGSGTNLNSKSYKPLIKNRGYTIEPGIYKKECWGVRSEIDFFLDKNGKAHITTNVQKNLECIPLK